MRRTSRSNCTLISEGKVMSCPKICTVAFSRFLDTELLRSFFWMSYSKGHFGEALGPSLTGHVSRSSARFTA